MCSSGLKRNIFPSKNHESPFFIYKMLTISQARVIISCVCTLSTLRCWTSKAWNPWTYIGLSRKSRCPSTFSSWAQRHCIWRWTTVETDWQTDWLIDWLIVRMWHHKGHQWLLICISQQTDIFFLLLHFLFFHFLQFAYFDIMYSLYNQVLKFPILRTWLKAMRLASASCFLDGKLWHRRGVEEFHPDCGESKTEYTFGTVPANKGWFLPWMAEWDQAKSQNKVNIRKQSQNLFMCLWQGAIAKKFFKGNTIYPIFRSSLFTADCSGQAAWD